MPRKMARQTLERHAGARYVLDTAFNQRPHPFMALASAPRFANQLLSRTAEVTRAGTRHRRRSRCRGGGRNAGTKAVHGLRIAIHRASCECRC